MSDEHNEHDHASDDAHGHDEHGHDEHGHGGQKLLPDDSPPQNRLIFLYTVLAVCTLVGLKFVFDSYLDSTRRGMHEERIEHSLTSERLAAHREEVREQLNSGDMPIDEAMSQLAERGRGAFPQVRPFASSDEGARIGWNRRAPAVPTTTPEPSEATGN